MNKNKFIYLDWNSTTPLMPSVVKAMIEAFEIFGNPSSIHLEGRKAKKVIEESRIFIGDSLDIGDGSLIFTSGVSESARIMLNGKRIKASKIEHPAVLRWTECCLQVDGEYQVNIVCPKDSTVQMANSETGIIQKNLGNVWMTDATQYFPKMDFQFSKIKARNAMLAPHKFGGPKGIGAILAKESTDLDYLKWLGSQEEGIRPGTENVVGIVGFAEAVKCAKDDKSAGTWENVLNLRNLMENEIKLRSPASTIVGEGVERLPNTTCILTPGWSGEKQVVSMDLEGFGVSFGSACSNLVSRASEGLISLGYSEKLANCAMRISIGPSTTKYEVERFVDSWSKNLTRQSLDAA